MESQLERHPMPTTSGHACREQRHRTVILTSYTSVCISADLFTRSVEGGRLDGGQEAHGSALRNPPHGSRPETFIYLSCSRRKPNSPLYNACAFRKKHDAAPTLCNCFRIVFFFCLVENGHAVAFCPG